MNDVKNPVVDFPDPDTPVKVNLFGNNLSYSVWSDKYSWDNRDMSPEGTFRRVVGAVLKGNDAVHAERTLQLMKAGILMPAGRILAGAGTGNRVTLMNCLSGDTEVLTSKGVRPLASLEGKKVSLLTATGWREGTVKNFGRQPLQLITFKTTNSSHLEYQVRATPNHRWLCANGTETTSLRVGQYVLANGCQVDQHSESYTQGFIHGLVFGDGQLHRETLREVSGGYPLGTYHYVLRLCGMKRRYLSRFAHYQVLYPPAAKGDPIIYIHTATAYKEVPDDECSPDYAAGFIDGWFAADGHLENGGIQKVITGSNGEAFDWLVKNAPRGGYVATGRKLLKKAGTKTNLGTLKNSLEGVTLKSARTACWKVISISPSTEEEVYCAVVPDEHAFTLAGGIYTGNCYVMGTIPDSLDGIFESLKECALTMQQGGGIGVDFSTLRPEGAELKRTGSYSSGPLTFM